MKETWVGYILKQTFTEGGSCGKSLFCGRNNSCVDEFKDIPRDVVYNTERSAKVAATRYHNGALRDYRVGATNITDYVTAVWEIIKVVDGKIV